MSIDYITKPKICNIDTAHEIFSGAILFHKQNESEETQTIILGERFFKLSNAMFIYGLTPVQFMVYSYLVCCAGSHGTCWPSMQTIATNCSCSPTTARAAVQELKRRGFINYVPTYERRYGQNRQTNNTYFILDLPPLPRPKEEATVYVDANGEEVTA